LVLGTNTLYLDDTTRGYATTQLDLGAPDIRAVADPKPEQHGVIDRTRYMGGRVVTANISTWSGGTMTVDDCVALFNPFMDPAARPVLHLTTARASGIEKTLTLRASAFSNPMVQPSREDFQLSWVASDPILRDVNVQTVTAFAGSATSYGRTYPLTFNRSYPAGAGSKVNVNLNSAGDIAVKPMLHIYGPVQGAQIIFYGPAGTVRPQIYFLTTFRIDAPHRVDVDCAARTAYVDGDPQQNVLNQIDWTSTIWPVLLPNTNWLMQMNGSSTTDLTQTQAVWQDGYLG